MIRRDEQQDESRLTRSFAIERLRDDKEQKTVYRVSLSSEAPVKDWSWAPANVLVHSAGAVDLSGINERGLGLFVNHEMRSIQSMVGRIVNVRVDKKRLVGELRFSEANPDAAMVRAMVDEGTLTDMSITAEPIERELVENDKGQVELVRWTKWRPVEGSVVGVGADRAVGIGRQGGDVGSIVRPDPSRATRGTAMNDTELLAADDSKLDADQLSRKKQLVAEKEKQEQVARGRQVVDDNFAAESEKRRQASIRTLGKTNNISADIVEQWVKRGYSLDQVADNMLAIFEERGRSAPQSVANLGLTTGETNQYSITRAILAAHDDNWEKAGLELECHKAIQKATNKIPRRGTFFVPLEVQRRAMPTDMERIMRAYPQIQRDLTVATAGAGGFLVQTSIVSFDELLRNISFAFKVGVTRLSGLRDSVAIPRQSAAATAVWLANEASTATESQQTFVQLALTPKTVGAYTEVSRQLLLQSSMDVEALVASDLAAVCALAVDAAVLNGSGSGGQPTGLDNTAGIGAVTGTSLAAAGVIEFQSDIATANVMPLRPAYVTTPAVAALLMVRPELPSTGTTRLWRGNLWNGSLFELPAMTTNQVAAATMYFGDWSKAVVAEWGILEIDTNPFANFPAGIIGVRAIYSIDVGIRYPAAFSRATTIT